MDADGSEAGDSSKSQSDGDVAAGFEAHLRIGDVVFGQSDATLLRAVGKHESLHAAANALGRSYSRAHERIGDLESEAGALLERTRGGSGGGGSKLTATARQLLARFDRLQVALRGTAAVEAISVEGTIVDRRGDLATVETPAGTVEALVVDGETRRGSPVQVLFSADAITLHSPTGAPDETDTSARNRFGATVTAIDTGDATATVTLDVSLERQIAVRVTTDSLERLAVTVGDDVVASFKATATHATAVERTDDGDSD